MSKFFCDSCNINFETKYSYNRHRNTQKCKNKNSDVILRFTCEYCLNIYNLSKYKNHEEKCKMKKEFIINQQKEVLNKINVEMKRQYKRTTS